MKEHLVREEQQRDNCLYCGRSLKENLWHPLHVREVLYAVSHCICGKKATVRLPFLGSGHDSWCNGSSSKPAKEGKTKIRTLESKIQILST